MVTPRKKYTHEDAEFYKSIPLKIYEAFKRPESPRFGFQVRYDPHISLITENDELLKKYSKGNFFLLDLHVQQLIFTAKWFGRKITFSTAQMADFLTSIIPSQYTSKRLILDVVLDSNGDLSAQSSLAADFNGVYTPFYDQMAVIEEYTRKSWGTDRTPANNELDDFNGNPSFQNPEIRADLMTEDVQTPPSSPGSSQSESEIESVCDEVIANDIDLDVRERSKVSNMANWTLKTNEDPTQQLAAEVLSLAPRVKSTYILPLDKIIRSLLKLRPKVKPLSKARNSSEFKKLLLLETQREYVKYLLEARKEIIESATLEVKNKKQRRLDRQKTKRRIAKHDTELLKLVQKHVLYEEASKEVLNELEDDNLILDPDFEPLQPDHSGDRYVFAGSDRPSEVQLIDPLAVAAADSNTDFSTLYAHELADGVDADEYGIHNNPFASHTETSMAPRAPSAPSQPSKAGSVALTMSLDQLSPSPSPEVSSPASPASLASDASVSDPESLRAPNYELMSGSESEEEDLFRNTNIDVSTNLPRTIPITHPPPPPPLIPIIPQRLKPKPRTLGKMDVADSDEDWFLDSDGLITESDDSSDEEAKQHAKQVRSLKKEHKHQRQRMKDRVAAAEPPTTTKVKSLVESACIDVLIDTAPTIPCPQTTFNTTQYEQVADAYKRIDTNYVLEDFIEETRSKSILNNEVVPLMYNPSQQVMSAGMYVVVFFRKGRWITPPAFTGCRLDPIRQVLLEHGIIIEQNISVQNVEEMEDVILLSSIAGAFRGCVQGTKPPLLSRMTRESKRKVGARSEISQQNAKRAEESSTASRNSYFSIKPQIQVEPKRQRLNGPHEEPI